MPGYFCFGAERDRDQAAIKTGSSGQRYDKRLIDIKYLCKPLENIYIDDKEQLWEHGKPGAFVVPRWKI